MVASSSNGVNFGRSSIFDTISCLDAFNTCMCSTENFARLALKMALPETASLALKAPLELPAGLVEGTTWFSTLRSDWTPLSVWCTARVHPAGTGRFLAADDCPCAGARHAAELHAVRADAASTAADPSRGGWLAFLSHASAGLLTGRHCLPWPDPTTQVAETRTPTAVCSTERMPVLDGEVCLPGWGAV